MKGYLLLFTYSLLIGCNSSPSHQVSELADTNTADKSFVSFVYHRFGDERYPSTNIGTSDFKAHLNYLKTAKFEVMTLSDAVAYTKSEGADRKVAVITVDDGYISFKSKGLPLLKEFGFPATLFINTETVGKGDYLDWPALKSIASEGVEIGNHSHSHAYFLNQPEAQRTAVFKQDVEKAQQMIIDHLGLDPKVFAYPYGEYSPEMREAIVSMGFVAAAAQNSGVMHSQSDYFSIPRYPMAEAFGNIEGFIEKANMKALLIEEEPWSVIIEKENPPVLSLTFKTDSLDLSRLQCFVQGGKCAVDFIGNEPVIKVFAEKPLKRRRTLYTITVPSKNGGWHWYSHLWVNPAVRE